MIDWRTIFKFTPRPLQENFIDDMLQGIEKYPITALVAPNGFGKTLCALTAAATTGRKHVYYTTRTQKQMQNVIRSISMINDSNEKVILSGIELAGRDRACVNTNKMDFESHDDKMIGCSVFKRGDECSIIGTEARDQLRVLKHDDANPAFSPKVLTADLATRLAIEHRLCPYY